VEEVGTIVILYLIGTGLLVAEIFIPSHGVLTVAGLGIFGAAIYMTFRQSETAGYIALLASLILLPCMVFISVKYWHRTPMGKRISPPNPVLTAADLGDWEARLSPFVGKVGRSLSPLRPVGTCEFDGQRLECIAEMGMIERDQLVKAVAVRGRNLAVAPAEEPAQA
jgi:membrane-bound serine protease (ClpP class)